MLATLKCLSVACYISLQFPWYLIIFKKVLYQLGHSRKKMAHSKWVIENLVRKVLANPQCVGESKKDGVIKEKIKTKTSRIEW